jgi:hypothetical protein
MIKWHKFLPPTTVFSKVIIPAFLTITIAASMILLSVASDNVENVFGYGYGAPAGGGGAAPPTTTQTPLVAAPDETTGAVDVTEVINTSGQFTVDVTITTADEKVTVNIGEDVVGLVDGQPLDEISVVEMTSEEISERLESLPTGSNVVSIPYDFGPTGAQFNPPITLTFIIDPTTVLEGTIPTIVFWDATASAWVELTNVTYDPVTGTVSGDTNHFTPFAVITKSATAPQPTETIIPQPTLTTTPEPTQTTSVPQPTQTTTTPAPLQTVIIVTPTESGTPINPIQTAEAVEPVGVPINWWVVGGILAVAVLLAIIIPIYIHYRRD